MTVSILVHAPRQACNKCDFMFLNLSM